MHKEDICKSHTSVELRRVNHNKHTQRALPEKYENAHDRC